jgi:hypothetical protein
MESHPQAKTATPPPELPCTWTEAMGAGPSSFERALDAVVHKLDAMEDAPKSPSSVRARTIPDRTSSARDTTVDPLDQDISDRDVLRGLKMAISAACNEDFDAWIRERTGLRLRRFLCDLKAFGDMDEETRPRGLLARLPVSQRTEERRLEAEMERRGMRDRKGKQKENLKKGA